MSIISSGYIFKKYKIGNTFPVSGAWEPDNYLYWGGFDNLLSKFRRNKRLGPGTVSAGRSVGNSSEFLAGPFYSHEADPVPRHTESGPPGQEEIGLLRLRRPGNKLPGPPWGSQGLQEGGSQAGEAMKEIEPPKVPVSNVR